MIIRGKVVSGVGKGAYFVEKYEHLFEYAVGFKPFYGTLNIIVDNVPDLKNPTKITPGGKFKPIKCYAAELKIKGENIDVFVIRPEATRHPENILEIIAPMCIKETYNVKDGDEAECSLE
ncbi:MAG TPA: DUF120 domain-containing protein [archaeon]|nr:DUF120 domain-containing protein [archaeon]